MNEVLKSYLKRLTNLSGNNRSLLLLRLVSDQFFDLHNFNFTLEDPSFHVIEELLKRKGKIKLAAMADSRDEHTNKVSRKLKKLLRIDKQIFEERGGKDLYVGWPFVHGQFSDGTPVRAPLLFFPVEIQSDTNMWYLQLRNDVSITFNKSFLLAYSFYNKIQLDEDLLEQTFDDAVVDSRVFRTDLYEQLKVGPLELNFNQEMFLDQLQAFTSFRKDEFLESTEVGVLKLYPEAVLGIFPQAGSYLVPDYLQLIEHGEYSDVAEFFESRTLNEDKDQSEGHSDYYRFLQKVKEEETYTAYKMDAFQENAIKAVKHGNSVVVQGPPGTGKSQLICNLITDFMARGKKVLLVCQKKAALDVVYERLKSMDFADFVGLVHDFKNDRKRLYEQINFQIEHLQDYEMKNSSLDAIQLERKFLQVSRKIDQVAEELEEFKQALFDESEAGVSVKELYLTSNHEAPVINIKQEYKYFRINELDEFISKLKTYFIYHKQFNRENYPWKNRKKFVGYGISDLQKMRYLIKDIPDFQHKLSISIQKLLGLSMDFNTAEQIFNQRKYLENLVAELNEDIIYRYFKGMVEQEEFEPDTLWLRNLARNVHACYEGEGPEVSLSKEELGHFQHVLRRRRNATKNFFKYLKWIFFSKEKAFCRKVLEDNNLAPGRKSYKILEKKVDNRLNLEHNITKMREVKILQDIPEKYDLDTFNAWLELQLRAIKAYDNYNKFRNFREYFNVRKYSRTEFNELVVNLLALISEVPAKKQEWLQYFRDARIENLLHDSTLAEKMIETLNQDFDALCDFDNLKESLQNFEKRVIDNVLEVNELQTEDDAVALFQNSLRLAWIEYIELKFPILRSVSSLKHDRMLTELAEAVAEKLQLSKEIVLLRARELVYSNVEFNRLHNLVTYRDLAHQVTKKRRIWPLRKLINHFNEEIFRLIPCWMASPESVSAIFPMDHQFDLVVFDEASQCFAERGIPAMYRGKQVVITGDDKQLSPFDLYKVRWEEDREVDEPELEIDSLLQLADKHLMQVQLNGHYRSQSLELIDFSNTYFYKGKLRVLPDRTIVNRKEPAIFYERVDGLWENQQNEVEAIRCVDRVYKICADMPDKSVGVVTFNASQQELILDLLEEKARKSNWSIPENVFVKNIENVQGDERDVIIFSIAYAPDKSGKLRHQFGSLNAIGGENRLNVAVTRAREKVIIITSILPHQLQTEEVKNDGPRLLKKYLQYAWEVSEGQYVPYMSESRHHSVDWYLKNKIIEFSKEENYQFELLEDMPFADLTVKENGDYKGLIRTDDNLYFQSPSVKDIYAYTPFTLRKKNWYFRGFYSREYWQNRESIKEKMYRFSGVMD